jgi:hypothetical protein
MSLRKGSSSLLEACFWKAKRSQRFLGAETHPLHNATRSDDMNFRNAIKADRDRNMSYSVFVDSLSHQHCLPFQHLGPRRAIGQIMRTAPSNALPTDAMQFQEAKAGQSDGGSLKLRLCVSVKACLMALSSTRPCGRRCIANAVRASGRRSSAVSSRGSASSAGRLRDAPASSSRRLRVPTLLRVNLRGRRARRRCCPRHLTSTDFAAGAPVRRGSRALLSGTGPRARGPRSCASRAWTCLS